MKHTSNPRNRSKLRRLSARLLVAMAAATSAHAAALTWDADTGTAAAQDGGGNWSTGAGGWLNGGTNVNWANNDSATFGAGTDGTYAVTVGSNIAATFGTASAGGVNFVNSGYTLSATTARTITMGTVAANPTFLTIASGKSATVGTNVKVEATQTGAVLNITGGGTLNITGTGAEVKTGNNLLNVIGGTTVNVGTGGILSGAGSQILIGTNSGSGTVNVNGGTVYAPNVSGTAQNFILANNSSGTVTGNLTINSGLVSNPKTTGGLRFGANGTTSGSSTGTVDLNGGTLEMAQIYEGTGTGAGTRTSTVNFNGGTLKVLAGSTTAGTAFMTGLDFANVKEGGAVINTNGVATLIGQSLLHGGVLATDGGLTKNGAETLTLSGTNTYTGPTSITAGGLTIGSGGSIASTSAIVLSAATTFTNSSSAISKAITLGEGSTIAGTGGVNALGLTVVADLSDGLTSIAAGSNFAKGTSLDLILSGATEGTYNVFSAATAGSFTSVSIAGTAMNPVSGGFSATFGGLSYLFTTANDALLITAVPEPATCAALLGAFALVGAGLRRRSTRA